MLQVTSSSSSSHGLQHPKLPTSPRLQFAKVLIVELVIQFNKLILCCTLLFAFSFSLLRIFQIWLTPSHQVGKDWSFHISPAVNIQSWFPGGQTGLMLLLLKGTQRVFSAHFVILMLSHLYGPAFTAIHDYWESSLKTIHMGGPVQIKPLVWVKVYAGWLVTITIWISLSPKPPKSVAHATTRSQAPSGPTSRWPLYPLFICSVLDISPHQNHTARDFLTRDTLHSTGCFLFPFCSFFFFFYIWLMITKYFIDLLLLPDYHWIFPWALFFFWNLWLGFILIRYCSLRNACRNLPSCRTLWRVMTSAVLLLIGEMKRRWKWPMGNPSESQPYSRSSWAGNLKKEPWRKKWTCMCNSLRSRQQGDEELVVWSLKEVCRQQCRDTPEDGRPRQNGPGRKGTGFSSR